MPCGTCKTHFQSVAQRDAHSEEVCSMILASKSTGTVPATSQKGSTMAKNIFKGPDYDEQKQEWTDYLTEVQSAIENGYCDDILKDIARAVFDRRDHLQGQPAGFSFRNGEDRSTPPLHTPPVKVQGGSAQFDGNGVFVGRIPSVPEQSGVAQFEVKGKYYNKKDLLGKTIRMPMTVNPSYVRALRVKVIGVGGVKVKVEWVDMPKEGSKYRELADQGKPVFVGLDTLTDILG